MPLSLTEFKLLTDVIKDRKITKVSEVMVLLNKDFIGNEVQSTVNTKAAMKRGIIKIERSATPLDVGKLREKEKRDGYKLRTQQEAEVSDELRKMHRK